MRERPSLWDLQEEWRSWLDKEGLGREKVEPHLWRSSQRSWWSGDLRVRSVARTDRKVRSGEREAADTAGARSGDWCVQLGIRVYPSTEEVPTHLLLVKEKRTIRRNWVTQAMYQAVGSNGETGTPATARISLCPDHWSHPLLEHLSFCRPHWGPSLPALPCQ